MSKLLQTQQPLTRRWVALGPPNYMYLIGLAKSFMQYYFISFPCESLEMQITADISKNSETIQRDLISIFYVISEYVINFVSNVVSLAAENVSFT